MTTGYMICLIAAIGLLIAYSVMVKSKEFWKAALIRAVRTLCQTAIATIGTTALLQDVNWLMVGSSSLLAALLSVLNSIATGLPEVDE